MNYQKQAENGYRGSDYPDDPQSVLPAEESLFYSLDKLTDEKSTGDWSSVRYIILKSNQPPQLSTDGTWDKNNAVEFPYEVTGLKFLAEEVIDAEDEGHYIMYNSEAEEAALNVASSENNVTSYYADKISKDKPADKRDTTMNLSRLKYIKVKVKDTDKVKLSLVKDGDTVENAVVVGEETGSGDRSVYFSLDGVDEDDLKNVDQICVETAVGGRVTWVSATRGEISYKLDGSEKKIEVKDGRATEVTLAEYGTEDPDWTPGPVVTAKPSVAPTETPEHTAEPGEFLYEGLDWDWIDANIDPEKPVVAMTFDDGPGGYSSYVEYGTQIQQALKDAGAHATFFYIGQHIQHDAESRAEVQQAVDWGFEIANHSWDSSGLNNQEQEDIRKKIEDTDALLSEISGYSNFLFRAPNVAYSDDMFAVIDKPFIDVSCWSNDWQSSVTKEQIVANVEKAKDGDIINMHSVHEKTAQAVPEILAYFKQEGIQVVSVSELFAIKGQKLMNGVKYSKCVTE